MRTWACEATRWSYVRFMAKKSDAKAEYKKFLEWVELIGFKVNNLNSDSGGEYTYLKQREADSEPQRQGDHRIREDLQGPQGAAELYGTLHPRAQRRVRAVEPHPGGSRAGLSSSRPESRRSSGAWP